MSIFRLWDIHNGVESACGSIKVGMSHAQQVTNSLSCQLSSPVMKDRGYKNSVCDGPQVIKDIREDTGI